MTKFKAVGCGVATAAALLLSASAQAGIKAPVTLQVTVKTSFGTHFTDCWTFSGQTAGSLGGSYGTLTTASGLTLTYAGQAFGTSASSFSSVTPLALATSLGFGIQFTGLVVGGTTNGYANLTGNDEIGDSYIITGPVVTSCGSSSKGQAATLYRG